MKEHEKKCKPFAFNFKAKVFKTEKNILGLKMFNRKILNLFFLLWHLSGQCFFIASMQQFLRSLIPRYFMISSLSLSLFYDVVFDKLKSLCVHRKHHQSRAEQSRFSPSPIIGRLEGRSLKTKLCQNFMPKSKLKQTLFLCAQKWLSSDLEYL